MNGFAIRPIGRVVRGGGTGRSRRSARAGRRSVGRCAGPDAGWGSIRRVRGSRPSGSGRRQRRRGRVVRDAAFGAQHRDPVVDALAHTRCIAFWRRASTAEPDSRRAMRRRSAGDPDAYEGREASWKGEHSTPRPTEQWSDDRDHRPRRFAGGFGLARTHDPATRPPRTREPRSTVRICRPHAHAPAAPDHPPDRPARSGQVVGGSCGSRVEAAVPSTAMALETTNTAVKDPERSAMAPPMGGDTI